MTRDVGILPNAVNRDPRSESMLILGTLADGLDQAAVQSWLTELGALVNKLELPTGRVRVASAAVGLGPRFFTRFPELAPNNPHGFATPPSLQGEVLAPDFVLHVSYTSEAKVADLLRGLLRTRPTVVSIEVEHGYARADERENFEQLDGLRNLSHHQRRARTRIDPDDLPEEPGWLKGSAYGAWMKIEQNMDAWQNTDPTTREQIIGRRGGDGSRLDLPAGANPRTEGPFNDAGTPAPSSHIRKTGPRGALHDQTLIFRRGMPYVEEEGSALRFGLHFISYQVSLDDFDVVLNQWMLNPNFPSPGAGTDALLSHGLVTFLRAALYVVVPADDRFPGAGYFDASPPPGKARKGRVHIRKRAIDANAAPTPAEVGDIEFQLIDPTTGNPIGEPARTNSAGRAVLKGARVGKPVIVRETPTERFEAVADMTVAVDQRNVIVRVENRLKPTASPYGG